MLSKETNNRRKHGNEHSNKTYISKIISISLFGLITIIKQVVASTPQNLHLHVVSCILILNICTPFLNAHGILHACPS